MNKELYVSSTPHETKVALVEDDQLAEVFFERENEYTLAGSIYKGRVTRVLPGMQSAFVDIGLERDAFLYVSDFLELGGEDEESEFGEIAAPKTTVDVNRSQQAHARAEAQGRSAGPETEEETETVAEDFSASVEEAGQAHAAAETNGADGASVTEETNSDEGARRWRGRRRRRGGRRGRDEQFDRREQRTEPAPRERNGEENRHPQQDFGPPPGYTPIVLPGESISKYRKPEPQVPRGFAPSVDRYAVAGGGETEEFEQTAQPEVEEAEQHPDIEQGQAATEPEQLEWAAAGTHHFPEQHKSDPLQQADAEVGPSQSSNETQHGHAEAPKDEPAQTVHEPVSAQTESSAAEPLPLQLSESQSLEQRNTADEEAASSAGENFSVDPGQPLSDWDNNAVPEPAEQPQVLESGSIEPDAEAHHEPAVVETGAYEPGGQQQHELEEQSPHPFHYTPHEAPSSAPAGRTLEHETLEDEEAEYQLVPENLDATREAAGDAELDLVEETLDADNGYERWVPKIADVDEDEIVAAEERGETYPLNAEEAEEEEEDEFEEEETNGRAELRAASPTAGYQQRTQSDVRPERGYDRRGPRDRGRRPQRGPMRHRPHGHRPQPLITDLLKEGQEILVQIAKEPIGKKGARITSHIALPGRFLVYMPTVNHVGVSRKIASEEERQRLKRIVTSERENGQGGFIVRTAAVNIKEDELRADIRFLKHLWAEIKNRAENDKSPALIYHDLNLVERVLRDQVNADFSQIWVDTEDQYERVVRFANRFQPSLVRRIKLYTKDTPLFEQFSIQEEINRSLKSKVWLKSGGYIVINQTEALVAIDINTGKYVGKTQRLEDTIVKTNVDAIKEIVRQIRLRDLGGIIVIDFIDMDERKNRQKVMVALDEALRNDRAPSKVLQFNDFGLVAITRKRVKQSLERTLGEPCPYCTGAGFVKSVPTVCNEIYIEMRKMIREHDRTDVTLRVNPEIAKALKANNGKLITEMEDLIGKTVLVKSDPLLHQENFDIH